MTDEPSEDGGITLLDLGYQLAQATAAEQDAKSRRLEIEQRVLSFTGFDKPEGQEAYPYQDDRGSVTITLKQSITTSVDQEAVALLKKTLGGALFRRLFRVEHKLNTAEARDMQEKDHATWAKVSGCLTRKPGKIGVKLTTLVMAPSTGGDA